MKVFLLLSFPPYSIQYSSFILRPRLNRQIFRRHRAESIDEGACQTGIRNQRDVEVDGGAADLVAVGDFGGAQVAGNVDHEVALVAVEDALPSPGFPRGICGRPRVSQRRTVWSNFRNPSFPPSGLI